MDSCDIRPWVDKAQDDDQRQFREAVHTTLVAIANAPHLCVDMTMKGGILLALRYESSRFTRDIDFSTARTLQEYDIQEILDELSKQLALAVEQLEYGLDCRVQSSELKPPRADATLPTLKIRIGYANKADNRRHKRLLQNQCPSVVEVDFSFNEPKIEDNVILELAEGGKLTVYSLVDIVAEKFRAMLQQETRNRFRRQDVYDLYRLLTNDKISPLLDKSRILTSLQRKAEAREMSIDRQSIARDGVIKRSREDYPSLQAEIEEQLPDFDKVYAIVRDFYQSLPWG